MGVRGEDDLAARLDGEAGEVGVEVLAAREAVDLDRHAGIGAGLENTVSQRALRPGRWWK